MKRGSMRKTLFRTNAIILGIAIAGNAQTEKLWTVLPSTEARDVEIWYSNQGAKRVTGTWSPNQADIDLAESRLSQVHELSIRSKMEYRIIEHPEQYFRQYIGIVQSNRKRIYLSAFCGMENGVQVPPSYWHEKLFEIEDGGSCVWQALFDVETRTFIELRVNGVG